MKKKEIKRKKGRKEERKKGRKKGIDKPWPVTEEDLMGWRAAPGIRGIGLRRLDRMAGCRDEYIDLMAGIPQIADNFAASHQDAVR